MSAPQALLNGKLGASSFEGVRDLLACKDFLKRQYQFDRAIRKVLGRRDRPISGSLLADVFAHWGSPLSPELERFHLSCVAETARSSGNVLQCGAGLTTLLIGSVCSRLESRHLWCLEHDPQRANVVRVWLAEYGIPNVHVIVAPPRLFEGYVWYGVDVKLLPSDFRLAICDGARATPSGVVGLVSRMHGRFASEGVVLARDVLEGRDLKAVSRWAQDRGVNFVIVDKASGFIKIAPRSKVPA